jgi:hypothetical protein
MPRLRTQPVGEMFARLGADGVVEVPVAPVKGVHGEQRGDDAEGLEAVELVFTQKLAVDQHGAGALYLGEARLGGLVGGDQQVGGALAVRVGDDLQLVLVGPLDGAHHLFGPRVAGVALRVVADRLVVGLVAPGGKACGLPSMVSLAPAMRKRLVKVARWLVLMYSRPSSTSG